MSSTSRRVLVDALVENNVLELLVQNLLRLNDADPDETAAVHATLATVENLIEVKPAVAEMVCEKTKLLKWLMSKIKVKEFAGNKQYASEMEENLRLRVEFQWFLMALSVRPLRRREMMAHLLPNRAWARFMVSSSSGVNGRCSTSGESWLHHRSRHDLPDRPGIDLLIRDQFLGP